MRHIDYIELGIAILTFPFWGPFWIVGFIGSLFIGLFQLIFLSGR